MFERLEWKTRKKLFKSRLNRKINRLSETANCWDRATRVGCFESDSRTKWGGSWEVRSALFLRLKIVVQTVDERRLVRRLCGDRKAICQRIQRCAIENSLPGLWISLIFSFLSTYRIPGHFLLEFRNRKGAEEWRHAVVHPSDAVFLSARNSDKAHRKASTAIWRIWRRDIRVIYDIF